MRKVAEDFQRLGGRLEIHACGLHMGSRRIGEELLSLAQTTPYIRDCVCFTVSARCAVANQRNSAGES